MNESSHHHHNHNNLLKQNQNESEYQSKPVRVINSPSESPSPNKSNVNTNNANRPKTSLVEVFEHEHYSKTTNSWVGGSDLSPSTSTSSTGSSTKSTSNYLNKSRLFQFWVSVVGYFAMGFTWEQVNGDADGTYNAIFVSPETFVLVSKALGVVSCVVAFLAFIKPKLLLN